MTRLSVNVDHVATVRQARQAPYPDPIEAATLAEDAGATGITIHLRSDRRHIQDLDLESLRATVRGKLNLEMAMTDEMVQIAQEHRPDQVTLVPERPDEVTTEGGLDILVQRERLLEVAAHLQRERISVSVFVDPEQSQIEALTELPPDLVTGFEINTDRYSRSADAVATHRELRKLQRMAALGEVAGLRVYAGHGLTTGNVGPVAEIPQIEELNIGHWIVARSILVGMSRSVEEMLHAMGHSGGRPS
jgi:pyridoxine 5-phosphate synthase